MMWNVPRSLSLGALCALALVGQHAARAEEAQPVKLAAVYKAKDTAQYKTTLNVSVGGADVVVEQTGRRTVQEIKENGDVVIVQEDLGGKVTLNGQSMDTPAAPRLTTTQNRRGELLTYQPEKEDNPYLSTSTQHLVALATHLSFPDKAVKPGDSWTTTVDNPQVQGKKVTITTTYLGTEKVDGRDAWKVRQTLEADTSLADNKLKADTTALLDAADGQLISAEQTMKGVPGAMGPVDWTGKVTRVKQ